MKESRYAHLLGGAIKFEPPAVTSDSESALATPILLPVGEDRLTKLETEVAALRKELEALKAELGGLRT